MRMLTRQLTTLTLAALLSTTVHAADKKKSASKGAGGMPPVIVTTTTVKPSEWQAQAKATGSLMANQGVSISPIVSGRITKINFQSGQPVKAGSLLFQLNNDVEKATLAGDVSQAKLNKLNMKRTAELYAQKAVSRQDYDTAIATLTNSQAQVDLAQAELDQRSIIAPFGGVLGLRMVSLGDYVSPGDTLVSLQALDPMDVEFSVPETYLGKVAKGQTVTLKGDSYPGETFTGKVYAFDSQVDASTRSLAMRAHVPNKDNRLMPGVFMEITLNLGDKQTVYMVPQTAIVYSANGTSVYLVENNEAKSVAVTVDDQTDKDAIITKGLKAGDVVVTSGQIKLYPGATVMLQPSQGKSSKASTETKQ